MVGYKNYIIKPITDNTFEGIAFKERHDFKECTFLSLEDLKEKDVYLILKPQNFRFEIHQMHIPVFKKHAIAMQLKFRVDSQGFLSGPYKLFWKVIERLDSTYTIFLAAIPVNEVEPIISSLKERARVRFRFITFLPCVLATLAKEEPQIIVHKEKEGLWLVLAEKSIPYYVEFIPVEGEVNKNHITALTLRIDFIQKFYRGNMKKEVNSILLTSPELKELLKTVWLQNVRSVEDVKDFNLYLAMFEVSKKFNVLSEEEIAVLTFVEKNKKYVLGLFFLTIIFFALFLVFLFLNRAFEKQASQKIAILNQSVSELLSQYPPERLKEFQDLILKKKEVQSYPQVSELLYKLVTLDTDFAIDNLVIKQKERDYLIEIRIEKKIEPENMVVFYQNVLRKIEDFVSITNSTKQYDSKNRVLTLSIQGLLKPKR
jgi:hypothetical protein